ncbi:hypothetical protein Q8P09_12185 [Psychrobacter faecalis]|uniref:Uncharacterized protein n=1 Tax=Psychrobacter faecalis TaxID=180588 RepID=A0ABT9HJC6_9GAMM|nr:hypothetical protein [Psychrobacter faecalis]MDP4545833.1 hypothetical protein [Psychrobacter faecalis]
MQLAQSYLQGMGSPFDGVLEAYGQGQVLRQNKDLLQAQQAEQARKIQAQQALETIDWNNMEEVRRMVAQFPEYTKGAQDYIGKMETKEKEGLLRTMSRGVSALQSGSNQVAADLFKKQAEGYRNNNDEEAAETADWLAEMSVTNPQAAQRALMLQLASVGGKDTAAAYASLSGANIAEDAAPVDRAATQAKTVNERVTAAGGVNKLISTAALTDDPNTFMEMIDTAYDSGLITPEKYNSLLESVSGNGEEAVATLRRLARGNPDIIDKLLPDVKYTDLGDGVAINSFDPQTGEVKTLGTMAKGINPETVYKENAATERNTYSQDSATNRTVYTVDQQAENARQSRELQAYLADQKAKLSSGEFTQKVMPDGRVLLFNKQGQWKPVLDTNGKPMISKPSVADKPLNESQANSLMYGERMQTANKILENLESTNGTWDIKGGGVFARANPKFGSEDFKKYEQAKRNFINAILRKESGAAIGVDEFESADKQYFPQIGDTEAVIKQKAANRRQVTNTMLSNVGAKGEAAKKTKPVKTNDLF